MLKEYGLDPALLHNWDKFRFYFLNNFGVSKGRWILGLPSKSKWRRAVYDALDDSVKPIQRERITEKLRLDFREKVIAHDSSGAWDDAKDWLSNAEIEYDNAPFQAIISVENPRNKGFVLCDDVLDEGTELWKTQCQVEVNRCAEDIAAPIQLLLQKSRKIVFIDQHFKPKLPRYSNVFQQLLDLSLVNRGHIALDVVEYHLNTERYNGNFQADCESRLPRITPSSIQVVFKEIKQKLNGERLHERYILTDLGGFEVSGGLDEGEAGQTTPINLLTDEAYKSIWDKYMADSPAFDLENEFTIQGTKA